MEISQYRGGFTLAAGLLLVGLLPASAGAQDSAALAKELATLLEQQKLTCVASKDPAQADLYYAALYPYPGQLLVVQANYKEPVFINPKIAKKEYMDVYLDLNSASIAGTKLFVMDLGADGLKAKPDGPAYDSVEQDSKQGDKIVTKRFTFDGDWKKQGLQSEDEYNRAFADAEAKYAKILRVLIASAKKAD
jgi:hypothetical protein